MKVTYYIFLFTIALCSCNHKEEKKELTKSEIQKMKTDLADYELEENKEKILLLSTIKEIPYDTLYSVLRDYYSIIGYDEDLEKYKEAIELTAKKHNTTKIKIAKTIFSFKYEMMDRQEIFETESEKQREMDAIIDEGMKNQ